MCSYLDKRRLPIEHGGICSDTSMFRKAPLSAIRVSGNRQPQLSALSHHGALVAAYADQDTIFAPAFALLEDAIAERAFPGAVAAVVVRNELVVWKGFGRYMYALDSPEITVDCVWDLASVTKVVAPTSAAMVLHERKVLDLEAPLELLVPEFVAHNSDLRRRQVTMRSLLAHSSGLPAYVRLFETVRTREELLSACCAVPLEAAPGERAEYSDIGFILLGVALEKLAGETLDSFCRREVFDALGLGDTSYCPPDPWLGRIPPTEEDIRFRGRVIRGEVNDENASVMGGVAGHAGVFSTALDVARFGVCMLSSGQPLMNAETVHLFTRRVPFPPNSSRALGWDTPSQPSQSGKYFSARSFGHLGFTGTSIWCDPERQLCVVLLTNRTWPDRKSQLIKQVRPRFHDAVIECLKSC